jgi:UDP-3-O-[3-hydroxymyristoyl] N-acetylglucosamine deacetylase
MPPRPYKPAAQKTLKTPIGCSGVGLHSGARVAMTLKPAAPGSGIVFHRTDLHGEAALVPASWRNVVDTRMCTALGNAHGARVGTVEHLMAALYGCAIDNAIVEIDGPEVPVMDGSAAPFVFLIECAGTVDQAAIRQGIEVCREVSVLEDGCHVSIAPAAGFSVNFEIDFGDNAIARQTCELDLGHGGFKEDLSRARTFGFVQDIDRLQAAGLARGGSLDNAVVISGNRILNDDGLRYDDEFVRHKMLDCVGDLYLAGAPLIGQVTAVRSGHRHNYSLLSALFADPTAYRYVDLTDTALVPGRLAAGSFAGGLGLGAAD